MPNTCTDISNGRKRRVVAVASFGGHFVQLQRIMSQFAGRYDVCFVTTSPQALSQDTSININIVGDFSRSNPWLIFKALNAFRKIFKKERPDVVISTGAAPGLAAVLMARLMGIRTLWIDSMANVSKLSACGRIASFFSTITLTQWPSLANKRVHCRGAVF